MNTYTSSLITYMKNAQIFMRITAFIIIFAHTAVIGAPTIDAIKNELSRETLSDKSPETELSETVVKAIENLALLKQLRKEDKDTDAVLGELKTLESRIKSLDKSILENFAKIELDLKAKKLPGAILGRHTEMVNHYKKNNKDFMILLEKESKTGFVADIIRGVNNLIDDNEVTPDKSAGNTVSNGETTFSTADFKSSHQAPDPSNPSMKSLQPDDKNVPKETKQEFILSGLNDSPQIQLAALGDFKFDRLIDAANPLYLAETDEVKLSEAIKTKAAKLNYDPVKIYEWVNHNVSWIPTWGAMQSSDLTLSTQSGNSFDIASLTIALLRASKIPARYVHGTIDVPKEKYTKWVGNFSDIDTASDFASAGGIPTITVTRGGSVVVIRMEHIWVEAAIDFHPSRGVKNKNADTWLQMDPSFKKYNKLGPVSGGFERDYDAIQEVYLATGVVTDDYIQGLDPSSTDTLLSLNALETSEVSSKIRSNYEDKFKGTIGDTYLYDILGGRKASNESINILSSSVPYQIKVIGVRFDKIPSSLQNQVTFGFHTDIFGDITDGATVPYAILNNQFIKLNFSFATEVDVQAMASFINENATTLGEINNHIPSYLVNVIPKLHMNGIEILNGNSMRLGEDLNFSYKVRFAGRNYPKLKSASIPAGSSIVVGVVGQGVSPIKIADLSEKFDKDIEMLTKPVDEIVEYDSNVYQTMMTEAYYGGMMDYYSKQIIMGDVYTKGQASGEIDLISGVGIMGYVPNVSYFFGVPRAINRGGIRVDVGHLLFNARSTNNNQKDNFNLVYMMGIYGSQLEATVPKKMFSQNNSVRAYSAAKLIQYANEENQKIYRITSSNASIINELELSSGVISEIRAAIQVGRVVITHQSPVDGYSGYYSLDPITAEGAYILDNGTNGGELRETADNLQEACFYDNHKDDKFYKKIAAKCNALAKKMGIGPVRDKIVSVKTQIDAVGKFMRIYIKMPMVMVDCMMNPNYTNAIGNALASIQTMAAMLAIGTALPSSLPYANSLDKIATKMEEFVDTVWGACIGSKI